ncbi:NAD(P)/FAD-dependent oxidoreductase [Phaeocystidibacter luteus]|uniref:NADH:ubiquinone reductase (non-electrogenic) n=1 Tax=Phaeocystidibacter luteus TaxID=911197 RepID=A0A6N6RIT7_9FLAO|nr:NAD(P)/FAD-dependent oxidoreductase [Phaeocystidibacter luteus]KAB2814212.1 NAD(P)/FAD-dependent oxidoreductase [Phaeocystidibacter luteus]
MSSLNIPESKKDRVIIVGGGFGGLQLAKQISSRDFQVVLIDKHNYHTFQPLLYQVATSGLEPDSIAYPLRKIFHKKRDFYFRVAKAESIDEEKGELITDHGPVRFDHLIIATGSTTNYFGNANIEKYSMPMKSLPEALDLRSLILQNFEASLLTDDLKQRERLMNYVIVGGGPTGVELAGAIGELKLHVLPQDYPDLDFRRMTIHLLEAAPRLLNGMSDKSGEQAQKGLEKLDVQVWTKTLVKDYDGKTVITENRELPASTLIWAAGVRGVTIEGIPESSVERGRILVDEHSRVEGMKSVYAIGDVALMKQGSHPNGHPMVAPAAVQQGKLLAKNLLRTKRGAPLKSFSYFDKGSMATIGRNKAVVDVAGLHFSGFFAWLVWMFVHLMELVGFRNRIVALVNWSSSYFSYDKGIRLIVRPFSKVKDEVVENVHSDVPAE